MAFERQEKESSVLRKEAIRTDHAPSPIGSYSQGLKVGNAIYTAGQVGKDPTTGTLLDGIAKQTRQALENIRAILNAAGAGMDNVVKITVYLQNLDDFTEFDSVYQSFFPSSPPVRTTVQSELGCILIEIDALAIL